MLKQIVEFDRLPVDLATALLDLGAVSGAEIVVKGGHIYREVQTENEDAAQTNTAR